MSKSDKAVIDKVHSIITAMDRMINTKSTAELRYLAQSARIDLDVLHNLLFLDLASNEDEEHE